jgi:hypothetical protein
MKANYNVTGNERKITGRRLLKAITGDKPVYLAHADLLPTRLATSYRR